MKPVVCVRLRRRRIGSSPVPRWRRSSVAVAPAPSGGADGSPTPRRSSRRRSSSPARARATAPTGTSSATRTDTQHRHREQIEDQALRSIADVLRYVPGATIGTGRGQSRPDHAARQQQHRRLLRRRPARRRPIFPRPLQCRAGRGAARPNAMIFGRGGGGGVVNRVTKPRVVDRGVPVAGRAPAHRLPRHLLRRSEVNRSDFEAHILRGRSSIASATR
jgi:hypothetical protein